jgi:gliding motility-associated-like protein
MKNLKQIVKRYCSAIMLIMAVCFLIATNSVKAQYSVLNNSRLRFGTGSEASVNNTGNLQQPFYYNGDLSLWRKLTYSVYPLDNAFAIGGDKTSEWNINGTLVPNPTITGQVLDISGFVMTSGNNGYGTIISTGTITISGTTLEIKNTYVLPPDKSYISITSKVKNTSAGTVENVRIWIGTRDDYVGGTDQPTKYKGNLTDGVFVQISNAATRAAALKITTATEGVLFYTNSTKGNTIINGCCDWSNVTNQNPETSVITITSDGSYGFYVRLNDLTVNASDEFTWYYAAGDLAELDEIINDVATVSGAVSNITYTTATFKATTSANSTGYWMVVPRNATTPTEVQIKAGVDYGGVTVTSHGSGAMTADMEATFELTGLTAGTNYDLYFVSEDAAPEFSEVLKVPFSSASFTAPVVNSTTVITAITGANASSGGNVSDDGGQPVTDRGTCWNTAGSPTIASSKTINGTGLGTFTSEITGLTHSTTYYVRAYATNSVGTSYGPQVFFTTLSQSVPTVSTVAASSVTQTDAASGGNVTSDGGLPVTARGICWNTAGSPALSDDVTIDGSGAGTFVSALAGLSPGTTYYIKAYATNSLGTAYGNQVSTITLKYPQTITFDDLPASIYGDDDFALTATASSGLPVSYSSTNIAVADVISGDVHIMNAGTTVITASQTGDPDYEAAADVPHSLIINKDTLTAIADDKVKIYGDADPEFIVSYLGFNFDDTVSDIDVLALAASETDQTTHTGEYPVTVSDGSDNNYEFKYVTGKLTVNKAMLTVTAEDQSKIYGEANPAMTVNYTGYKNADDESVIDLAASASSSADETSSTGPYTITPAGAEDTDYDFSYANGMLTILKKEIMVTADEKSKVYGEPLPALTVRYTGLENNDTEADIDTPPVIATEADQASPKGSYTIKASDATDNNYTFIYTDGMLIVSPADMLITAENKSITYADALPELTWITEGFVLDDDESMFTSPVEIGTPANEESDAGSYAITVSGAAAMDYYNITFVDGALEINKAVLTLTANDQERPYAQENPVLTFSFDGFVKDEDQYVLDVMPVVTTEATLWTPVGEYSITPGNGDDQNYSFVYQNAILTIIKADQEIEFEAIPNGLHASTSYTLAATANSELIVTFLTSDPVIASFNGNELMINLEGSVIITAMQPGDNNWNAAELSQTVLTIPSFNNSDYLMTPNGDGINDYWHINYLEDFGNTTILIYNRWGKKVFETSEYTNDWDGSYGGSRLPAGSYYFIIDSKNKGVLKGVINIVY